MNNQHLTALSTSRAWAEISADALIHNARLFSPESRNGIMAVVKANAYGHGAVPVGRILSRAGVRHFCVATLAEGMELRSAGISGEILILGYTPPMLAGQIRDYNLTQTVIDQEHGRMLEKYAGEGPINVHIAVDTGMHRLGISWETPEKIADLFHLSHLHVTGVFSHLCAADSPEMDDHRFTLAQFNRFDQVIAYLHRHGFKNFKTHIQSSYGVLNYSQFQYDYSRIGIALYGVYSSPQKDICGQTRPETDHQSRAVTKSSAPKDFHLIPAMTIKARIARILHLNAGDTLGYGRAYTAPSQMKIAVISIGYADGIPRNLDENASGYVLINGQKAPIIGRICMDQLFADVTHIAQAQPGMETVILGTDPVSGQHIDAAQFAHTCHTISNEILSRLGNRLERIYV